MDAPPRAPRLRRLLVGAAITLGTVLVLAVLAEVAARLLLPKELLSFKPIYASDPVAGYALVPSLSEYALGAQVAANSIGHRGPEWSRDKPEGVFRIALIGDSMAFGFGVEFADTVGEVLARTLRDRAGMSSEVLNFGVPGYNARQELAVFEQRALDFDPDAVIVLICGNDHEDMLSVDRDGWLHRPPVPGESETRITNPYAPRPSRWGLLRHSAALLWAKATWKRHQARDSLPADESGWLEPVPAVPVPPEIDARVMTCLRRIESLCQERGIPMVLASVAAPLEYRVMVEKLRAEDRMGVIDLATLFPEVSSWREMADRFGLGWDSHPNAESHRRWGEGLFELMAERGIVPGK